jgi:signal transduction histidine kinase
VLKLRVRDDGVGLPEGWQFQRDAGVGLRNVAARLEHLYRRTDLLRISPVPSGGVDVQLDLPLQPMRRTSVEAVDVMTSDV